MSHIASVTFTDCTKHPSRKHQFSARFLCSSPVKDHGARRATAAPPMLKRLHCHLPIVWQGPEVTPPPPGGSAQFAWSASGMPCACPPLLESSLLPSPRDDGSRSAIASGKEKRAKRSSYVRSQSGGNKFATVHGLLTSVINYCWRAQWSSQKRGGVKFRLDPGASFSIQTIIYCKLSCQH